jgi:FkbM family methyltransferase
LVIRQLEDQNDGRDERQLFQLESQPGGVPMHAEVNDSNITLPDDPLWNPAKLPNFRVSYFRAPQLKMLISEIFLNGAYLFHTDKKQPLILDCGSNIGISILFFKMLYPGARIIGFEPDPDTFEILRTNVRQNSLHDVELQQCALYDREGAIDLHRGLFKGALRMSLLEERLPGRKISVSSRRLSSFITEDIDLLKLDIEGAEQFVLQELADSAKLSRIDQIHIEYHHHIIGKTDTLSSTLKLLEDGGFGYQISAHPRHGSWPKREEFQDISIYCYRKR